MWPFRRQECTACQAAAQQRELEREALEEGYAALLQRLGEAEAVNAAMRKAMTSEGIAAMAKDTAVQIADIFAAGRATVLQRDVAVRAVVAAAIRLAASGEKHWNAAGLAAEFDRENRT